MVILHIAPLIFNKPNGIFLAVVPLVEKENLFGDVTAGLWGIIKDENKSIDGKFSYFSQNIFKHIDDLPEPYNFPNLVVFHTVYEWKFLKIANHLKKKMIPYIIVPHCSLTIEAQKQKSFKKHIANRMFFYEFLKNAISIRYTAIREKDTSINDYNNFIVGNGMEVDIRNNSYNFASKEITFIGRFDIHQKGLDILLKAVSLIKERLEQNNFVLNLYGNDQDGSVKILNKMIDALNIGKIVKLHQPIFGEAKRQVLLNSKAFIHTSRFEGLSMMILEALASGVPCIVTPGTNILEEISDYDAGWGCELDEKSVADTILEVVSYNKNDKSKNATLLVNKNYSWNVISKKTIDNYKRFIYGNK